MITKSDGGLSILGGGGSEKVNSAKVGESLATNKNPE